MAQTNDFCLVFQLPENFFADFDAIVAFENKMINIWPKTCTHDGHDIGDGTVNFWGCPR